MKINEQLIKKQLENVYFITGTAAAGKSTTCKILSEKYQYVLYGENQNISLYMHLTNPKSHPNLHYFNTMNSWEEFVMRDFIEYENWMKGLTFEITPFQILDLIQISKDRKVIAETNMPIEVLKQISSPSRIAVMLTTPTISKEEFFKRSDQDKNFILSILNQTERPKENIERYKNLIEYLNRDERIKAYKDSSLFYTFRHHVNDDLYEKVAKVEEHFQLNKK